jgi:hypothetical protein
MARGYFFCASIKKLKMNYKFLLRFLFARLSLMLVLALDCSKLLVLGKKF